MITTNYETMRASHLVRSINATQHPNHVQALIDLLVKTGDLTTEQAQSACYEPGSVEHGFVDLFHVGGVTRVYPNGTVEAFPN